MASLAEVMMRQALEPQRSYGYPFTKKPRINNKDGSFSTERTITVLTGKISKPRGNTWSRLGL